MKSNWVVFPQKDQEVQDLSKSLGINPLIAQILFNRGICTHDEGKLFLESKLQNLRDPFLFKDMEVCIRRILKAYDTKEKVVFYGDYDVDGISSSALLSLLFTQIGLSNECYIPHRINEGYGLSKEGIDRCLERGANLLITVDCGIHANEQIAYAKSKSLDVIVTDHHEPSDKLPECVGLLNQKIKDSGYPFRDLAGVGVAFKLAHGLIKKAREENYSWAHTIDLKKYLDLVALGTIADIVPLKDENRILAKAGFKCLEKSTRPGIRALLAKSGILGKIGSFDVGFKLAPRLNATGRIGDAKDSLAILKTSNESEAEYLAANLDNNNRERQRIEVNTLNEALAEIDNQIDLESQKVIVLSKDTWPVGVLGIVASRILRTFYRPTFIIGSDGEFRKGSGRSIEGFDLSNVLAKCKDDLEEYGGHAFAAGIRIKKENIAIFRDHINQIAQEQLSEEQLLKKLKIDCVLDIRKITEAFVDTLTVLEPFGQDNAQPVFLSRSVNCIYPPVLLKNKHIKFTVQKHSCSLECIGFNMGDRFEEILPGTIIDLVYTIGINEFNGRRTVQLTVKDFCSVS